MAGGRHQPIFTCVRAHSGLSLGKGNSAVSEAEVRTKVLKGRGGVCCLEEFGNGERSGFLELVVVAGVIRLPGTVVART